MRLDKDVEAATLRELADKPHIQCRVEQGRKHIAVVLYCGERRRKVFCAITPSDRRALANHVSNLRRMIREVEGAA